MAATRTGVWQAAPRFVVDELRHICAPLARRYGADVHTQGACTGWAASRRNLQVLALVLEAEAGEFECAAVLGYGADDVLGGTLGQVGVHFDRHLDLGAQQAA